MTKRTRYFVFGSVTVLLVGLCTGLVAYYTGMPMGAFGQTSALPELKYVPGNAAVVAYADVRNVMQSELRQKLHKANTGEDQEDGQAEFQKHTGIDIENDIDRVVAFMEPSATEGPSPYTGMIVATGRFDLGRFEAVQSVEVPARVPGYLEKVQHQDRQIVDGGDRNIKRLN